MLRSLDVNGHCLVALPLGADRPGEPIILLHGITHSVYLWAPDPTYTPYGPCYSLSLPDHVPASSPAAVRPLGPEQYADLLSRAIAELTGGVPATLIGVSTGGFCALAVAAQAPGLVRRVVCISGFTRGRWIGTLGRLQRLARGGPLRRAWFYVMFWLFTRSPLARPLVRQAWADTAPRRSIEAFAAFPHFAAVYEALMPTVKRLDLRAMQAAFAAFPDIDISAWLPRITAPTLVVYGDGDTVVPPEQSRQIAAAIPGARLVAFPGAGHYPNYEDFPRFQAVLADWMRETAR